VGRELSEVLGRMTVVTVPPRRQFVRGPGRALVGISPQAPPCPHRKHTSRGPPGAGRRPGESRPHGRAESESPAGASRGLCRASTGIPASRRRGEPRAQSADHRTGAPLPGAGRMSCGGNHRRPHRMPAASRSEVLRECVGAPHQESARSPPRPPVRTLTDVAGPGAGGRTTVDTRVPPTDRSISMRTRVTAAIGLASPPSWPAPVRGAPTTAPLASPATAPVSSPATSCRSPSTSTPTSAPTRST
jgi:hypothetical protein